MHLHYNHLSPGKPQATQAQLTAQDQVARVAGEFFRFFWKTSVSVRTSAERLFFLPPPLPPCAGGQ